MKCDRCALLDDTVVVVDICVVCGPVPMCPGCAEQHRAEIAEGVNW